MSLLEAILVVLLVIVFAAGVYVLWLNLPGETVSFGSYQAKFAANLSSESTQFYPNMRFEDKKISYYIESACSDIKRKDIESALNILSQKTILTFYESNNNPEINFLCSEIAPTPEQEGHFVAGEGGPTEIINDSVYSVILASKVSLYRSETCNEPQIALHEILHALGFDHNSNPGSIMYPITDCKQKLDDYITNEINTIYLVPSEPDLTIESANATESGRYIDFRVGMSNIGLKDVQNSTLSVLANNQVIRDFDMGSLEIGTMKFLNVSNLRGPSDTSTISFIIKPTPDEPEINEMNNRVDLSVKG